MERTGEQSQTPMAGRLNLMIFDMDGCAAASPGANRADESGSSG
eukprot:CAMPEP_0184411222 /NCGR_PEP_ID=MMETSP0738-20130409/5479_1 /TAXON_ID=385413 /ORGANISM="Thalassiosira miniscula, Strain CCMP1093" /LENGTH=43 /DNA_ID= /DNA_START= /DNA_END= /DNA_ORIENTATION=